MLRLNECVVLHVRLAAGGLSVFPDTFNLFHPFSGTMCRAVNRLLSISATPPEYLPSSPKALSSFVLADFKNSPVTQITHKHTPARPTVLPASPTEGAV